jgi:hypothetical protein
MSSVPVRLSHLFTAGALGGLINGLAVWLAGDQGLTALIDVKIAPALTPAFLYARVVWGGIWGLIFVLPIMKSSVFWRGLILSLGPTAVQLWVVFPMMLGKGNMGLQLGAFTPAAVVAFNAIWGWTAALWLKGR